ncbi:Aste57867_15890 [Aphanomyces stellatus]|uniref:Aste57867_15890 protein n=1 Tax=Aphanomyces stellatus TaxID=120398 RepID=A0A485L450_9STRA|nr:hypothetical protein As57867_015834 [Aphanomyces stellatus]VFT92677.1 Aste57867_15890 [Aphanomyces stellatus]
MASTGHDHERTTLDDLDDTTTWVVDALLYVQPPPPPANRPEEEATSASPQGSSSRSSTPRDDDEEDRGKAAPANDRNASRKRRRDEIACLRRTVTALESELAHVVAQNDMLQATMPSQWKRLAALLATQPRLTLLTTNHDPSLHLPNDPHERLGTARAIVSHQYPLLDSVVVAAGMADCTTRTTLVEPKVCRGPDGRGMLVAEGVLCRVYDLPVNVVADRMWQIVQGAVSNSAMPISRLETFTDDLVYVTVGYPIRPTYLDRHLLWRVRDDVAQRHVFVYRSILHDEWRPIEPPYTSLSNGSAWTVIEPLGPTQCCFKYIIRATPPLQVDPSLTLTANYVKESVDHLLRDWTLLLGQFDHAVGPTLFQEQ